MASSIYLLIVRIAEVLADPESVSSSSACANVRSSSMLVAMFTLSFANPGGAEIFVHFLDGSVDS
jgi:hypothetical protein